MKLTVQEREVLTKAYCEQYRKLSKKKKGIMLDQFINATGYNRSYAGRLLRNHGRRVIMSDGVVLVGSAKIKTPRKKITQKYDTAVLKPLIRIWKMMDYISAKRFAAALPEVIPKLEQFGEIKLSKIVRKKLLQISPATIDRLLKPEREKYTLKKRVHHTKPGTLLKSQIPIRTFSDWDDAQPGFFEMDLVGHDGGSVAGDHCFTLDMTDVCSGWSEQVAVINKAQVHVFKGIQSIRDRLPIAVLGLDSDNGSEFINHHLLRYCEQENITFTRSRPYRKNDTCFVEQKNWSIVRRFTGYMRLESQKQCDLLNELYDLLRDYNNFFMPSMRLKEKTRDGAKVTRKYHAPKTPYQMLLDSTQVNHKVKRLLKSRYGILNPAELHRRIDKLQEKLLCSQKSLRRTQAQKDT